MAVEEEEDDGEPGGNDWSVSSVGYWVSPIIIMGCLPSPQLSSVVVSSCI